MAQTWQVIRGSTTYTVSGGTYSWRVSAVGTGAPPKRNLSVRGPFQDGSTNTGFRYDPRVMSLVFYSDAASLSAADVRRDDIYSIWKGIEGQSVKVRVTRDDGGIRQIDGEVVGVLDMPDEIGDRLSTGQRFAVQLECHNPMWYNPTQTTATLASIANVWHTAGGLIPTANRKEYGTSIAAGTNFTTTIANGARWAIYMEENLASISGYLFLSSKSASPNNAYFYVGTNIYWEYPDGSAFTGSAYMATGNHTYLVTSNGTSVSVYRDNVLIASNIQYGYGFDASSSKWAQSLGTALDKGAIYDITPTTAQRAAWQAIFNGTYVSSYTLTYPGQWRAYPIIEITAPAGGATNPTITNTTTNSRLKFSYTLAAGNTIQIDCRYGYKTVKLLNDGTNLIDKLTADSNLADFAILPAGEVDGGINVFALSGGTITMRYNTQYLGL